MTADRLRATTGVSATFALLALAAAGTTAGSPQRDTLSTTADAVVASPASLGEAQQVEVPTVPARALAAASLTKVDGPLSAGQAPSRALAAYTLAAQAIQNAEPSCSLRWSHLAAIARVESDHGRADGSRVRPNGAVAPAVYGERLDGKGDHARRKDTDRGRIDGDRRWDRAVGPMRLLPATWSVVGVDGDGDGERNPQDLDDAALAVAVYLCAAGEDAPAGKKMTRALRWYNSSPGYAEQVLRLEAVYAKRYGTTPYSAAPALGTWTGSVMPAPSTKGLAVAALEAPEGQVLRAEGVVARREARTDDASTDSGRDGASRPGGEGPRDSEPVATEVPGPGSSPSPSPTPSPSPDPTPGPTPGPTPDPTPEPEPTPDPKPTPEPDPEPTPDPEPVVVQVEGVVTECDTGVYCLDGVVLLIDETWAAETALVDLDVDGVLETNLDEIAGAAESGEPVLLSVVDQTDPLEVTELG